MRIAIIGQGHVGKGFAQLVMDHYDVVTYDPEFNASYPQSDIDSCDIAVVCVPTPMKGDGGCDTSIVEASIERLSNPHILIKSTIPPGTTDHLRRVTGKNISCSPEYVGESTYFNPVHRTMKETDFLIVGGPQKECEYIFNVLEPILGPYARYFSCTSTEAEIIKYMENSFLATKVTFVNEFFKISQLFESNWHTIREGWLLDERIGRSFSSVFAGNRGFGGKCLPKDVSGIISSAEKQGYTPDLLKQVLRSNQYFQSSALHQNEDLHASQGHSTTANSEYDPSISN